MKITFNLHGFVAIALITIMFIVAFVRQWNISWIYFLLSIFSYGIASVYANLWLEGIRARNQRDTEFKVVPFPVEYAPYPIDLPSAEQIQRLHLQSPQYETFNNLRFIVGCHIAFFFAIIGFTFFPPIVVQPPANLASSNFFNFLTEVGYLIASVAGGMGISFLLLRLK